MQTSEKRQKSLKHIIIPSHWKDEKILQPQNITPLKSYLSSMYVLFIFIHLNVIQKTYLIIGPTRNVPLQGDSTWCRLRCLFIQNDGANHVRRSVFGHHDGLHYACAAIVIISSCHITHIVSETSFMQYHCENCFLSFSFFLLVFLLFYSSFFHSFIFSFCFLSFCHSCKPFYMVVHTNTSWFTSINYCVCK